MYSFLSNVLFALLLVAEQRECKVIFSGRYVGATTVNVLVATNLLPNSNELSTLFAFAPQYITTSILEITINKIDYSHYPLTHFIEAFEKVRVT